MITLICLLYTGMKIGYVMAFVSLLAIYFMRGFDATWTAATVVPSTAISNSTFAAMALFMMVGEIIYRAGFGKDLFNAAEHWLGRVSGGLAMATAASSAVLGFITSSNVANIAMGKIAVPEMRSAGYSDEMTGGAVAGGASMASIVPPSAGFIIYAMLSEVSLSKLYMAAIIPAIILFIIIITFIWLRAKRDPVGSPKSEHVYTFREKVASLKLVWPIIAIIVITLGGIYAGIMTATESAALCSVVCLLLAIICRRLDLKAIKDIIVEQAEMQGMIALMMTNAWLFQRVIVVSGLATKASAVITASGIPPLLVIALICLLYIIFGMFSDITACMTITVPLFFPIITAIGYNGVWFGVLIVSLCELGMISPPFGMNVFSLSGITGLKSPDVFKGCLPYCLALILLTIIVALFPQVTLWIPSMM